MTAHLTIVIRQFRGRAGYSSAHFARLHNAPTGTRTNLCGAALTDRDLVARDFRRTVKIGAAEQFNLCVECIRLDTTG